MTEDRLSNGFHPIMYAVWELLDKVDIERDYISMNAIKLGKLIKRIPLKSKHTLDDKEIHYFSIGLKEIYMNWATFGHPEWKVRERDAFVFTIVFERK